MIVLAIDPGASGGVALVRGPGDADAVKMPDTERDTLDLIIEFSHEADVAVIEKVGAMPGQGVTSMFSFGRSYGFLRACLIACELPLATVTPGAWQRPFSLPSTKRAGGKTAKKNAHKARAQELFPKIKMTHALADALLIGEWRRRSG